MNISEIANTPIKTNNLTGAAEKEKSGKSENSIFDIIQDYFNQEKTAPAEEKQKEYSNPKAKELKEALEKQKSEQGFFSKAWDGIKNLFGAETGSKNIENTIAKLESGEISEEEATSGFAKYEESQTSFGDKLSGIMTTVGMVSMVAGAVLSFIPGGAVIGAPLMAAGKTMSLGGMFVDNAIDLVDKSTDGDGLTGDEFKDIALETGVEAVSYMAGRTIGKFTNGINNGVTQKLANQGMGKLSSTIIGHGAEIGTDMALSLGADYAIAQGQSYITTGEFIDAKDYWSLDRIKGEGKNQLIGILTGLGSSKINGYTQATSAVGHKMILNVDTKNYDTDTKTDTEIKIKNEDVDCDNTATKSEIIKNTTTKSENDTAKTTFKIKENGEIKEITIPLDESFKNTKTDLESVKKAKPTRKTVKDYLNKLSPEAKQGLNELKKTSPEDHRRVCQILNGTNVYSKTQQGVTPEYFSKYVVELTKTDGKLLENVVNNKIPVQIYDDIMLHPNAMHAAYGQGKIQVKDGDVGIDGKQNYKIVDTKYFHFAERASGGPIIINGEVRDTTKSLAHEFGHAYDYNSGKNLNLTKPEFTTTRKGENNSRYRTLISFSKEFDKAFEADYLHMMEIDVKNGKAEGTTFDELLTNDSFNYYLGAVKNKEAGAEFNDLSARKELYAQMASYATSGKVTDAEFSERVEELFPNLLNFTRETLDQKPTISYEFLRD